MSAVAGVGKLGSSREGEGLELHVFGNDGKRVGVDG